MYLRFMQLQINPDTQKYIRGFYEQIVLPDLQKTPGCLYCGLVQNHLQAEEFIFISLWDTLAAAEIYEDSAAFLQFLKDIKPFLAESTEWKLQLSENLELQYDAESTEPEFKGYQVTAKSSAELLDIQENLEFHLRLVSLNIERDKISEFRELYNSEIIPTLFNIKGCLYAYLIEGIGPAEEIISLTIWSSKKAAEAYEKEGNFSNLIQKVQHTFSQFYQWNLALKKESGRKIQSSQDMKIKTYGLVAAKKIKM